MASSNPKPPTPPTPSPRASDFSAGSSSAQRPALRRAPRSVRALGWLLMTLVALALLVAAGLWWWAGSSTSLATALARAAQYLPAGQTLESREVSGALRSGGRIGWLRWSSPTLTVEVTDMSLGWQLAPLLQRRLELGEVHAARVLITPQTPAVPTPDTHLTPLTDLVLPVQIGVPFRVDAIQWAGAPAVQALGLQGSYRFDGSQHRLHIDAVELAQGRYSARAALQAQAPMALDVVVDGNVQTTVPGSTSATPIQLGAHATLRGTLATEAARLELQARVSPVAGTLTTGATTPPAPSSAAPAKTPNKATANASAPAPAEPMQADVRATLAPWAPQPLLAAAATLRAVNAAALWPQAPVTQLHGTLQAGPTASGGTGGAGSTTLPTSGGWSIEAQLRNDLPGPWDLSRLPVTALQASATFDGTRWDVRSATLSAGTGSATVQGHFSPATGALEGQADLRALRPDALHTALAAAPLSGRVRANTQGAAVRFSADIRATPGPAASPSSTARASRSTGPAPLRINTLTAQGYWQPPATAQGADTGGSVRLDHLLLDALQARLEATNLRIALGAQSAQGQLALTVPGATAQASGQIAPQTGAGELQVQWADASRTLQWLTTLPLVGADLQRALQGATAQGTAQITARWKGGWQTAVQALQAASVSKAPPTTSDPFELHATLNAPQLDLARLPAAMGDQATVATPQSVQLRALTATLSGNLAQASLVLNGEARTTAPHSLRATVQTRVTGGLTAAGQWQAQISALRLQAQDTQRPGPWALQLAEPLSINTTRTATALTLQTSGGQARLSGPAPGIATLRWQPVRVVASSSAGTPATLQTQGTLQGLPTAWVDALGVGNNNATGAPGSPVLPAPSLLARMGLATSLVLDGQWNVDTTNTLRASASLRRASGDLRILTGDTTAVTAVQSSGQGTGAGTGAAITTEASASAANTTTSSGAHTGTAAGVRQAEISIEAEGDTLRARLLWDSDRAGEVEANVSTRLATVATAPATMPPNPSNGSLITWAPDAPLAGTLRARLPDVGVWSALAPPGWRVRGTLDASATLSGTRSAPRWAGTLGADDMAVRSVVDGVDLQGGHLRATLQGNQLNITEFRLQGGRGSGARIAGFSGNRTAAPQDGGTLTATGRVSWGDSAAAATGLSGMAMSLQAEAKALQVLVRADRQISVSGQLQAQLQQGQISLRGKLTTDRATIILPDETAPSLGSDVVVRSASKDREDQAKAQAAAKASQVAAQAETAKPPDIAITLNLGRDFALSGHGITTRLTGEVDIRSSAVPGAPPRVTGEVRTDEGRYRAWGQMLNVETGLIRFNGPYNNPSLDILALRPNISVRAGVQVTGSAQAPRVKLYADPDLPDAEKLSWVVLGRNASAGGAEAAVLQQAALALLGRNGGSSPTANVASRLGLDEIGFRGASTGEDASAAALTFGKRLSKDLYVTYERSLSGTLGTLYIFYDLSRRLTLRGQTGEKSAVDIIYTMKYD